ncbi:MAG TPA: type II toxin-antitoxin system HipA family toxin [bacterium]|nr:type II toxin-antitoxin system HipA family toxin [bacterium]
MIKRAGYLRVKSGAVSIGRLGLDRDGLAVFEYAAEFIETGFSISPFFLPLKPGIFVAERSPFNGMFGVFSDSLPDGWGRLVLDRLLAEKGMDAALLTELDRLSITGANGMGALEYFPESKIAAGSSRADIEKLAAEVKKALGEKKGADYGLLVKREGSSGGVRPKAIVREGGAEWIVKFPGSSDRQDIGVVEYEYSAAAKKCGIIMEDTKLFNGKYYGIKRFDRRGKRKIHVISAAALLNADFRIPSLDYTALMRAALALTKDMREVVKVFRLMVFNVLSKNRDDHAKNFSFMYDSGKWRVSPAYDLVRSGGFNGRHTTTVAGSGLPGKKEIFAAAQKAGPDKKTARRVYDEVADNIKPLGKYLK